MTESRVHLRAVLLGLRIDTRSLDHPDTMALSPLTLRAGARGTAFVFRYGVAVFCDATPDEERAVIELPAIEHRRAAGNARRPTRSRRWCGRTRTTASTPTASSS